MRLNRILKIGSAKEKSDTWQLWGVGIGKTELLAVSAAVACVLLALVLTAPDQPSAKRAASRSSASAVSTSATPGAASEAVTSTPAAKPAADSTYIGCLRTQDDGRKFVLTEVGGANAPRTRNWKTLFVTKKPGKLDVTPTGTVRLRQHVGQTVQLTGKRTDDRFAARSVRMIGSTCS